jgi:hypothetical protein
VERRAGDGSAIGRAGDLQRRDAEVEHVILADTRQKPSDEDGYAKMAHILWQTSARDRARPCHWN